MAVQGKLKTVALLNSCHEAYEKVPIETLALLCCAPLDFASIRIRVFSSRSFQSFPENHSHSGFFFLLADCHDQSNLFHLHSGRATRHPALTNEAELLALDDTLLRLRNQLRFVFQLVKKEMPAVS